MGTTKRGLLVILPLAVVTVSGFLAAGAIARSATQATGTVYLRTTKLGPVLVSSSGRTLYLFAKDRNGRSACSGSCATFWPPLISHGTATAGSGIKASLLGTVKRTDGSMQVTYNRHPLYRFKLDTAAGQTKGEGNLAFGAKWYAVSAKGTAVVKTSSPTTSTAMTTTSPSPYPP
jgi:predicted lipoprotein with Yx(FWY)xxD motif